MKVDKEVREDNTLLEEIKMLSRLSHENVLRFAMFSFFFFSCDLSNVRTFTRRTTAVI